MVRNFNSFRGNDQIQLNVVETEELKLNSFIVIIFNRKFYISWLMSINNETESFECLNFCYIFDEKVIKEITTYLVNNFNAINTYADNCYFNNYHDALAAADWLNAFYIAEVLCK